MGLLSFYLPLSLSIHLRVRVCVCVCKSLNPWQLSCTCYCSKCYFSLSHCSCTRLSINVGPLLCQCVCIYVCLSLSCVRTFGSLSVCVDVSVIGASLALNSVQIVPSIMALFCTFCCGGSSDSSRRIAVLLNVAQVIVCVCVCVCV